MGDCVRHRGPDASGTWAEDDIGFAHRRLAVVGLGDEGAQPMHSPSGRFVLTYNGEIYNHQELRRSLGRMGPSSGWRGQSDTETLAVAVEVWGLEAALERVVGMFAFALWDRANRTLTLVRDRIGEKPLYWMHHHQSLFFASQPRSLWSGIGMTPGIDPDALDDLLRYARVPGARTMHRGVLEVEPGTLLRFTSGSRAPEKRHWWSGVSVAMEGTRDPLAGSEAFVAETVETALQAAVTAQAVADVPVGAFLSGGIDSSLIVALLAQSTNTTVRTFTVGFSEHEADESRFAREVAERLGTEHTEVLLSASEALAMVPRLPEIYDEPIADISQVPTALISTVTRSQVTVALSGDGGDELFGGYPRYWKAKVLADQARRRRWNPRHWGSIVRRRSGLSTLRGGRHIDWEIVHGFASARRLPQGLVLEAGTSEGESCLRRVWESTASLGDLSERFMAFDLLSYLPEVLLHKVDRAAMAVSLETRMPMLDPRVIELAWRLPVEARIRGRVGKRVLRRILEKRLPHVSFDRPKAGFVIPVDNWLRGPLRGWAEDLLDPELIGEQGLLDHTKVAALWADHRERRADLGRTLWPILMFQSWHAANPH